MTESKFSTEDHMTKIIKLESKFEYLRSEFEDHDDWVNFINDQS
jgi:hypothetical protein